jgi:Haem-binding domain
MKKKIIYSLCLIFLLLQLIPISRNNPPVEADLMTTEKIKSILKRSCYDCHSNETRYPLYSYLFPASVFLSHHIEEGRDELNFSNWESLSSSKKAQKAEDIMEVLEKKEMPLISYRLIHRDAILSEEETELLINWAKVIKTNNDASE